MMATCHPDDDRKIQAAFDRKDKQIDRLETENAELLRKARIVDMLCEHQMQIMLNGNEWFVELPNFASLGGFENYSEALEAFRQHFDGLDEQGENNGMD